MVMKYNIKNNNSVDGACGTTLNACAFGEWNDIPDSDTEYRWNCNGVNGSTVNASCSLPIPVNGACGTTLNTCTSGEWDDIPDSDTEYRWNCNGANEGTNTSCSLAIPTGSPDLIVANVTGLGSMFEAGTTLTFTVTIRNQIPTDNAGASTASANACTNRQFTVKGYQGSLSTPVFTWNVSDLDVGQSVSKANSFVSTSFCGIHTWCTFSVKVDADSCVGESNETNNSRVVASYRTR
ncbi:MAG: hypothetical protein A2Y97_01770 [Nitrospirae bacterium RBG_13_39_12]|nr:MAG: hypothetical protein A2Y97_01770 [Nitrospirae bacterium RBG_13_39_12]